MGSQAARGRERKVQAPMKTAAIAAMAVLMLCGCSKKLLDCDTVQGYWAAWNYRAEMGYLDSAYVAQRDSILTAQYRRQGQ